jgi:hypothetical protein
MRDTGYEAIEDRNRQIIVGVIARYVLGGSAMIWNSDEFNTFLLIEHRSK